MFFHRIVFESAPGRWPRFLRQCHRERNKGNILAYNQNIFAFRGLKAFTATWESHIGQVIMRLVKEHSKREKYNQIYLLHYSAAEDFFSLTFFGSVKRLVVQCQGIQRHFSEEGWISALLYFIFISLLRDKEEGRILSSYTWHLFQDKVLRTFCTLKSNLCQLGFHIPDFHLQCLYSSL